MREFALLRHIYQANAARPGHVIIPPGDDMGMIEFAGQPILAAVDQVVDGVHVRVQGTPIELIGRKAVTRCLSDVAAMAARPAASLAAVTLPRGFNEDQARRLFEAMHRTAAQFECPLIGGDIAVHHEDGHPLVCSVTVLALPGHGEPIRRSGARVGDRVYVTGRLGGSYASDSSGRHLTFDPRIAQALELAQQLGTRLHAMIDLSDGLGRDASHIAEASSARIILEASCIPCTPGVDWRRALSDGEDYELCFTAVGEVLSRLSGGLEVTAVGEVVPMPVTVGSEPVSFVLVRHDGTVISGDELGWQHQS